MTNAFRAFGQSIIVVSRISFGMDLVRLLVRMFPLASNPAFSGWWPDRGLEWAFLFVLNDCALILKVNIWLDLALIIYSAELWFVYLDCFCVRISKLVKGYAPLSLRASACLSNFCKCCSWFAFKLPGWTPC